MFEGIKKEDEKIVLGDQKQVEDVFKEIDPAPEIKSAVQNGKLQPMSAGRTSSPSGMSAQPGEVGPPKPLTNLKELEEWGTKKSKKGFVFAAIILVLALGGVSAGVYYYFSMVRTPVDDQVEVMNTNETPDTNVQENANTNEQPEEPKPPQDETEQVKLIDADLDGLTDAEEQTLGTDPEDPDTDSDGLSDRDETRVHQTNPLNSDTDNDGLSDRDEIFSWVTDPNNPDTDGDTYRDGAEVDNGYDPNGPGRLTPDVL